MKHAKIIGLVAVAAAALMAFVGAGTASAATSTLCSEAKSPCPEGQRWPLGTVIDFSLKPGTSANLVTTNNEPLDTCTESTVKGILETDSTKGTLAGGKVTELTWGNCTFPTKTLFTGGLQVEGLAGGNGTVKSTGKFEVEIKTVIFGTCNYGVTEGTDLGELKEGKPATFVANAVAKKLGGSFLCPETSKWSAEYVLTEPANTTLYVSNP